MGRTERGAHLARGQREQSALQGQFIDALGHVAAVDLVGRQRLEAVRGWRETLVEGRKAALAGQELRADAGLVEALAEVRRRHQPRIVGKRREADVIGGCLRIALGHVGFPLPVCDPEAAPQSRREIVQARGVHRAARRQVAQLRVQCPAGIRSALGQRRVGVRAGLGDVVRVGGWVQHCARRTRVHHGSQRAVVRQPAEGAARDVSRWRRAGFQQRAQASLGDHPTGRIEHVAGQRERLCHGAAARGRAIGALGAARAV